MIVRRLRIAIGVAVALGVLTIVLGYIPVSITDMDYQRHLERAGSDELTLLVVMMMLPVGWAYRRPKWPLLVMWIMWLTTWLMLGAILFIADTDQAYEMVDPFWMRPLLVVTTIAMALVVDVVLPVLRGRNKSPPPSTLPNARVVDR